MTDKEYTERLEAIIRGQGVVYLPNNMRLTYMADAGWMIWKTFLGGSSSYLARRGDFNNYHGDAADCERMKAERKLFGTLREGLAAAEAL